MLDVEGDASIAKKSMKDAKPLRADQILAQRSAVPAVSMKRRPGDKTTTGIIDSKRQRTSYVSHKELTRLRSVIAGKGNPVVTVSEDIFDPWSDNANMQHQIQHQRFSFLPKSQKKVAPPTMRH